MSAKIKVLFVCMGNICRSPAGEGMLRYLAEKEGISENVLVASCGIGVWNTGASPEGKIRQAALARGIAINTKAKPFIENYLEEFDYLLASDEPVLQYLLKWAKTPDQKNKIHYMTAFGSRYRDEPVPDPYRLGEDAFEEVLDILDDACRGLILDIKKES